MKNSRYDIMARFEIFFCSHKIPAKNKNGEKVKKKKINKNAIEMN